MSRANNERDGTRKGVDAARYAAPFDSVWLDFSKGLGCPVGAAVGG